MCMCVVCDLSPNTVGRMSMAFNGDGHIKKKKKIPGRKEGKKIKAEEDQDRREHRDTDTLRWV